MEEALVKLIVAIFDHTVVEDTNTDVTADLALVESICEQAHLALSPWATEQLVKHIGKLRRPNA